MSVKISELPILSSLADNDVIAGVDTSANVTSKIEMATLKTYIDTNTQYTAGKNINITNNVISAPFVYDKTQTNALLDDFKDETNALIEDLETSVNEQLEEKDEQIEELQSEVDSLSTIFNAFPTESGEGESLTLDDTAEVKFKKFDLKGNTSQTTYSGKNIIKNTSVNQTINGITYVVNNDGSVKVSGTASARSEFYLYNNNTIPLPINSGISYKNTTNAMVILNTNDGYKTFQANSTTSSGSATQITQAYLRIENGTTVNETLYPMISEQGGTYEPYVGGTASPNPSYPQPVNVVSGDNEIVISGKNLLNLGNKEETTDTNGLTYKVENNVITISGTNTSTSAYSLFSWWDKDVVLENRFQKGSTFTVSSDKSVSGLYFQINYDKEGTSSQGSLVSFALTENKATFTVPQDFGGINHIFIGVYGTATTINTSFSIQLEYGSTKSSFIPFDMSQYDINLIVSKNIFNINTILRGYDLTAATGAIKQNATWYASDFIGVKPSTNYTSTNISSGLKCWYDKNKTFISYTTSTTATSPVNARYMRVNGTLASIESDSNLMIEEGSSASTYVPYESIELCKIGNYQDYFYKDSDKWYLHKEIGKVVLDGSNDETWTRSGATTESSFVGAFNLVTTGISNKWATGSSWLCDKFVYGALGVDYKFNTYNGDATQGYIFWGITIPATLASDINAFRAWLNNNNVTLYYVLKEPITTQITYQPLLEQLNLLEKAMSKDGQTNISQVSNDKPFSLDVTAIKSLQNVLDRIELLES